MTLDLTVEKQSVAQRQYENYLQSVDGITVLAMPEVDENQVAFRQGIRIKIFYFRGTGRDKFRKFSRSGESGQKKLEKLC